MKRRIIGFLLIITVLFNIVLLLNIFGITHLCWWVFTAPYLGFIGTTLIYWDLSDRISLRSFLTFVYLLIVFFMGIFSIIFLMGDQRIERGSHLSYSGSVICTCPTPIDNRKWWGIDDCICGGKSGIKNY